MTVPILNASGCLDALAAPDVARSLDAFVTKTVTPLPREGNPPEPGGTNGKEHRWAAQDAMTRISPISMS